jgi:hypothetical protein
MLKNHKVRAAIVMLLFLAPGASVSAQDRGGIRSETEERKRNQLAPGFLWNVIGLLGLAGLAGLHKGHDEDSYHPAPFE